MESTLPSRWFRFKERFRAWAAEALLFFAFRSIIAVLLGSILTAVLCLVFGDITWEYFFGGYVGAILIVWGIAFWMALNSI